MKKHQVGYLRKLGASALGLEGKPHTIQPRNFLTQRNHAKVSETIESETFDDEAIEGEEPERGPVGRPTVLDCPEFLQSLKANRDCPEFSEALRLRPPRTSRFLIPYSAPNACPELGRRGRAA